MCIPVSKCIINFCKCSMRSPTKWDYLSKKFEFFPLSVASFADRGFSRSTWTIRFVSSYSRLRFQAPVYLSPTTAAYLMLPASPILRPFRFSCHLVSCGARLRQRSSQRAWAPRAVRESGAEPPSRLRLPPPGAATRPWRGGPAGRKSGRDFRVVSGPNRFGTAALRLFPERRPAGGACESRGCSLPTRSRAAPTAPRWVPARGGLDSAGRGSWEPRSEGRGCSARAAPDGGGLAVVEPGQPRGRAARQGGATGDGAAAEPWAACAGGVGGAAGIRRERRGRARGGVVARQRGPRLGSGRWGLRPARAEGAGGRGRGLPRGGGAGWWLLHILWTPPAVVSAPG